MQKSTNLKSTESVQLYYIVQNVSRNQNNILACTGELKVAVSTTMHANMGGSFSLIHCWLNGTRQSNYVSVMLFKILGATGTVSSNDIAIFL